jgi:hypothetical protein
MEVKVGMIGKRGIVITAGSVLMLAAFSAMALAHGFGGHGRGGHDNMFLLAHAAGLDHSTISSAFKNDTNLEKDRDKLKSTHELMMTCLLSGKDCTSQITDFSNALQAMAQERMTVWQGLLQKAPNLQQAANVYSQLKQLQSQRRQIMQGAFGSQTPDASPNGAAPGSEG